MYLSLNCFTVGCGALYVPWFWCHKWNACIFIVLYVHNCYVEYWYHRITIFQISGACIFQNIAPMAVSLVQTEWDSNKCATQSKCLPLGQLQYWSIGILCLWLALKVNGAGRGTCEKYNNWLHFKVEVWSGLRPHWIVRNWLHLFPLLQLFFWGHTQLQTFSRWTLFSIAASLLLPGEMNILQKQCKLDFNTFLCCKSHKQCK